MWQWVRAFSFPVDCFGGNGSGEDKEAKRFSKFKISIAGKMAFPPLNRDCILGIFYAKKKGTQIFSLSPFFLFMASPTGFEPVLPA
jgi:hypothetical protein